MNQSSVMTFPAIAVHRVEVRPSGDQPDPRGESALSLAREALGRVDAVHSATVYLIEAPLDADALGRIASELLADPVSQRPAVGIEPSPDGRVIEVHYKPGVMDPVAQSTRDAIVEMLPELDPAQIEVRTAVRYDFVGLEASEEALRGFAERTLANPVIQDIHDRPYLPERFPHTAAYELRITHVPLRELDDEALSRLSREAHLFLSLDEMRAVRDHYRALDRDPTDIELETFAQTWSEHCVHKTLKSRIHYHPPQGEPFLPGLSNAQVAERPGHALNEDGSVTIDNLLRSTIAAATRRLMESPPHDAFCISVFEDNAGIVRFDEQFGVCIKVETHNHPSAIEPYGGAATGIGGCIRDIMGTGLAAAPIANTDVFCVAPPGWGSARRQETGDWRQEAGGCPSPDSRPLPKGVIHPRRILEQVVAGVLDYGNRMGIPTVNGAVYFHEDYLGNPLVFAGCIGLIPLDKAFGHAQQGDHIIVLGGATGRDGIHGATFSSAELTDTHADEFAHAVQIGNPITQKKMLDVILQARDLPGEQGGCLYRAITDCGAGGLSSAVGEMGERVGATVHLERAPLKYQGLSYTEIWISEAQERMVLAVPAENVDRLRAMCEAEDVTFRDLGEFGLTDSEGQPELALFYEGAQVGRLSMSFLHEGIPTPTRQAAWRPTGERVPSATSPVGMDLPGALHGLLAHPNIASKHWISRQYDHEVQGGAVVRPLVGAAQDGPSDGAVLRPRLNSERAIAIGCGLAPQLSEVTPGGDSYWMALAAMDEAVRNLVCVGADPHQIAILDNFCWPGCDDPHRLACLVRAAEACYDGALAYGTPFVSGKDSLNNQFTTEDGNVIAIPPTLLITGLGIVPEARRARTMDAKAVGNALLIVGATDGRMGGSHYAAIGGEVADARIPCVDLKAGPANARAIAKLIEKGFVASAHDCSDGGLLVAAAEMAFAGRLGLELDLSNVPAADALSVEAACFSETPSRYLLEVAPDDLDATCRLLREAGVPFGQIGRFSDSGRLAARTAGRGKVIDEPIESLLRTWKGTLDW